MAIGSPADRGSPTRAHCLCLKPASRCNHSPVLGQPTFSSRMAASGNMPKQFSPKVCLRPGIRTAIVEVADLEGREAELPFRNVQASRQKFTDIIA